MSYVSRSRALYSLNLYAGTSAGFDCCRDDCHCRTTMIIIDIGRAITIGSTTDQGSDRSVALLKSNWQMPSDFTFCGMDKCGPEKTRSRAGDHAAQSGLR